MSELKSRIREFQIQIIYDDGTVEEKIYTTLAGTHPDNINKEWDPTPRQLQTYLNKKVEENLKKYEVQFEQMKQNSDLDNIEEALFVGRIAKEVRVLVQTKW
ncbi:hypothetical protein H7S74_13295 [Priestia aryabhattai]|uniref:hypothetical protein n=1 Tax=Priestia aryabhattai TaxID=412384 RepID=UPI001EBA8D34|nr:hypothetical protein [Priestia aryabhattai]MBY0091419.1 hypothetical protein [Priestia aryabhattai]MBY0102326.1 hypothetical protein [Priestia aryabhattai]